MWQFIVIQALQNPDIHRLARTLSSASLVQLTSSQVCLSILPPARTLRVGRCDAKRPVKLKHGGCVRYWLYSRVTELRKTVRRTHAGVRTEKLVDTNPTCYHLSNPLDMWHKASCYLQRTDVSTQFGLCGWGIFCELMKREGSLLSW
jgi:hypothetical protein